MFGYVTINKPEMKFKDFDIYRSYYCGLCKTMANKYGNISRMSLSFDVNFLVLLLSSLYEPETVFSKEKCIIHHIHKQQIRRNECVDYGADVNLILAYAKLEDDWNDDRKKIAKVLMTLIKNKNEKVKSLYSKKIDEIHKNLDLIHKCEEENETKIDIVAGAFGNILAEIYIYKEDEWEEDLRRMGFYLGKFIYIMDAYDDLQDDIKNDNYNPLKCIYDKDEFEEKCYNMLLSMMTECTKAFECLPIVENVDILRNILYAGVWGRYIQISRERKGNKDA